jgi:hypothetical protein
MEQLQSRENGSENLSLGGRLRRGELRRSRRGRRRVRLLYTLFIALLGMVLIVWVAPAHFMSSSSSLYASNQQRGGVAVTSSAQQSLGVSASGVRGGVSIPQPGQPGVRNTLGVTQAPAAGGACFSLIGGIDWGACLTGFWGAVTGALADALKGFLNWIATFGFMFLTPPDLTYNHVVVQTLWKWALGVADAALGLFMVVAGYNALMRHTLGANFHSVLESLPRLLLALVAANASLVFISSFVDLNNVLCAGVQVALAGVTQLQQLPSLIFDIATLQSYVAVAYLFELVMGVLIAVQMLVRIALLDVLIVLSPIWLLMLGLKQTERFGRLGALAFATTLFLQFIQVVTMAVGGALVGSFGPAATSPITILVGLAALYLTFKIPGMLYGSVLKSIESAGSGLADAGARLAMILAA